MLWTPSSGGESGVLDNVPRVIGCAPDIRAAANLDPGLAYSLSVLRGLRLIGLTHVVPVESAVVGRRRGGRGSMVSTAREPFTITIVDIRKNSCESAS